MDSVMDDVNAASPPFGSANAPSYQVPVAGRGLTTNDALTFLKLVKETFHDHKEKYTYFLDIMKDFKAKRTDTAGVLARVKELFKGHNNLLLAFNVFLPTGFKIILNDDEPNKTVDIDIGGAMGFVVVDEPSKTVDVDIGDAVRFVEDVKKCYADDRRVYATFLDILQKYLKVRTDEKAVYNEVAVLFDKHPHLLDEFTTFLHPRLEQMHLDKKRDSVYGTEVDDDVKAMVQVLKEKMQSPKEDIMDHDNNGTIFSLLDLFRRLTT